MNKNSSGFRVVKHFDTAVQLIVRTIVGTIFGVAGAFLGSLVNAALIPPTASDDVLLSIARISVIGVMAALIAQIGWIKIVDSWIQSMLMWIGAFMSSAICTWLALIIASALLDNPDLYMLNRDIAGIGLLGGAIGCNLVPLAIAAYFARRGEL